MRIATRDVIERVCALCAVPSVSGSEGEVGKVAAALLRRDGLEVEEQEVEPGRHNVIARLRTGRPGPRLLFNGHLDTLPPPGAGWSRDPYAPEVAGGRLYAAEVNNMKGAVGAMIAVMADLARDADGLGGEIILSAVVGECDSLGLGTVTALKNGLAADACINGEPTDLRVMTCHAGVTQVRLVVRGRAAHVSQRTQGVDAIAKLVALLRNLSEALLTFDRHPDFPQLPTLHVGALQGGGLPSMLAHRAEALIDVRTVPGMTTDSVMSDLRRYLSLAQASDPSLVAEVQRLESPRFMHPLPFYMRRDAPIVRAVADAHAAVTGTATTVGMLFPQVFFGSDASHIRAAGIPTAIYGPGKVSDISTPDESIAVADLMTAAAVYAASARTVCARVEEGAVR
jgi:acetylornithine deacetylase